MGYGNFVDLMGDRSLHWSSIAQFSPIALP
jgi:hypothetical protein